jgi:ABC-type Fe3+-siderophore transport system permease subunit
MRFHDGEVTEEEARLVEAALDQEPALLEELEAYSELGSFVRAWGESHSEQQQDIAEDVMRALEPAKPPARVHALWPRVATWVSLGAAIAAGSVLVARSWSAPPATPNRTGANEGAAAAHAALVASSSAAPEVSAALEAEPPPPPATIESVDFGKNSGTVFVVSTDSSETPVVWMPDDGEPDDTDEDRSESL